MTKRTLSLMILTFVIPLVSFGGRYYDARVSRFLTPDPKLQKYPSWSPYNYGLDNPLINIDPDGKEVKNSHRHVLSNPSLVNRLMALDVKLSSNLNKNSSEFKIEISGGDRYLENGKVYSQTNNSEIPGASLTSKHIQDNGALAVDISTKLSTVNEADMIQAAKQVGFTEILTSDYYAAKDQPPHLHLGLPDSYQEFYDNSTTIDYDAIPDFTPQPLPVKDLGAVINDLVNNQSSQGGQR